MIREMVGEEIYYPGDPDVLRPMLQRAILDSDTQPAAARVVIAPFGGYRFTLPYLGMSMRACSLARPEVAIVLAPPNDDDTAQALLPEAEAFATPFGTLPVEKELAGHLARISDLFEYDEFAHLANHSIELLLPPLHYLFGPIPIVPILLGRVDIDRIPDIAEAIAAASKSVSTITILGANLSGFASLEESDGRSRQIVRLLMTSPGRSIIDNIKTMENPVRSLSTIAVGHILAGDEARPSVLARGIFDTEYDGDTGSVALASIAYM